MDDTRLTKQRYILAKFDAIAIGSGAISRLGQPPKSKVILHTSSVIIYVNTHDRSILNSFQGGYSKQNLDTMKGRGLYFP